jgi:hypothetical protein
MPVLGHVNGVSAAGALVVDGGDVVPSVVGSVTSSVVASVTSSVVGSVTSCVVNSVTSSVGCTVVDSAMVCGASVLLLSFDFWVQFLDSPKSPMSPKSSSQSISYRTSIVILLRAGFPVTLETCEL